MQTTFMETNKQNDKGNPPYQESVEFKTNKMQNLDEYIWVEHNFIATTAVIHQNSES